MPERFIVADDLELSEIEEIAYALEWGWVGTKTPPESPNFVKIYQTLLGATVLYVADAILGVRYFLVNGPHRAEAEVELVRAMRLMTRDEIIAEAERANGFEDEAEAGRRLLAVAGDTFEARVFTLLRGKFFANADPRIRKDMILGFSYVGWLELRPVLEELATRDPNADIRDFAAKGLAAWDAERAGKPL